jgi:putative transposase
LGLQIPPPDPESWLVRLYSKNFTEALRSMPGVKLETIGFDKDHLLMVMSIPPRYSIALIMRKLKS